MMEILLLKGFISDHIVRNMSDIIVPFVKVDYAFTQKNKELRVK